MEDSEYRDIREVRPCMSEDTPYIIWSSRGSNELGEGGGGSGMLDVARSDGEDSETSHKCFVSLPSSHRSSHDSSAESCYTGWGSVGGGGGLSKKNKKTWKKLLKMEMMRLVEEQDTVWKEAQNAIEGMERRVEVLEDAKIKLEDSFEHLRYDMRHLRGGRVGGQQEGVLVIPHHTGLAKMETGDTEVDLSRRYSSMYTSPIFEEKRGTPRLRSMSTRMRISNFDHLPSKDSELRKLKSEIHKLRLKIEGRDKKLSQTLMVHQESPSSILGYQHMEKFSPRLNVNEINGLEQKSLAEDDGILEDMRSGLWINDCSRDICAIQGSIQQEDENEANIDMGVKGFQVSPKALDNSLQEYITTNTSFQDSSNAQDGENSSVSESIEKPFEGRDLPRLKMTVSKAGKSYKKNGNTISEQLSDVQSVNDMGECLDLKASLHMYHVSPKQMKLAKMNDILPNEACKCNSFRSEELEGLKFLLEASRKKCEEEIARNKFLEERLQKQVEEQKKLVDEHALKLERTEKALWDAQELNTMLTKGLLKSEATLTDLLSPYKGILNVSLENRIGKLQMINNMHSLREMRDEKESQGKSDLLKQSVEEKEEQIAGNVEYSRKDLKIQEEVESSNPVSMSQDISHFFDENEKKVASLEMEVRKLQQDLKESAGSSSSSVSRTFPTETDLVMTQKDIKNLKVEEEEFKYRYNSILSKVCSAKKDLRKREEALERLRKELVAIVKGDSTRDEGSYVILRRGTNEDHGDSIGKYNNHHHNNNNQSGHHCLIIELEGKLTTMEEELLRARNEMARLKDENVELRRSSWSSMHKI